jgi:Phosphatidylinositol transfer protein
MSKNVRICKKQCRDLYKSPKDRAGKKSFSGSRRYTAMQWERNSLYEKLTCISLYSVCSLASSGPGGTVDFRGQLYMVAKSSQEETGKEAGEGIEIIKNHPYAVDDPVNKYKMEKGQYTYVSWRVLASLLAHCSSLVDVDA